MERWGARNDPSEVFYVAHHPTGKMNQLVVGGEAIEEKREAIDGKDRHLKVNMEADFFLLISGWVGRYICLTWPI